MKGLALLRQQRGRKLAYRKWFDEVYERDWKAKSKPGREAISRFAQEYEGALAKASPFDVLRRGTPERLTLNTASSFHIDAYVLWAVTFAQNYPSPTPYTEDGLMLVKTGARFASKKAAVYEAPLCFCWAKHSLERLCERSPVGPDFESRLKEVTEPTLKQLSLALAFGLTKVEDADSEWGHTAWVPLLDGLLICTNRYVTGERLGRELGWRFSFTKHQHSNVYIKKDLLISPPLHSQNLVIASGWFATTFIGAAQMSSNQRQYVEAFKSMVSALGGETSAKTFLLRFDPDSSAANRPRAMTEFNATAEQAIGELERLLTGQAFRAEPRHPVSYLLDDELSTKEFRSAIKFPAKPLS